jgi:putative acetyltransferase
MSDGLLMIEIREEEPGDREFVRRVNLDAFNDSSEAAIVEKLRDSCDDYLAFVAVEDGHVVGHIVFTPATLDGSGLVGMGLAPMAVLPARQRNGIGSQLVRHGLEHVRQAAQSVGGHTRRSVHGSRLRQGNVAQGRRHCSVSR